MHTSIHTITAQARVRRQYYSVCVCARWDVLSTCGRNKTLRACCVTAQQHVTTPWPMALARATAFSTLAAGLLCKRAQPRKGQCGMPACACTKPNQSDMHTVLPLQASAVSHVPPLTSTSKYDLSPSCWTGLFTRTTQHIQLQPAPQHSSLIRIKCTKAPLCKACTHGENSPCT
jgi:hypothetical protein